MIARCAIVLAVLWHLPPSLMADGPLPRKNVLFIVVDDLNMCLGCYGHAMVKSPHIDRLAQRGVRFDRAYCQYPFCGPSRASFLSGRRPETTRIFNNHRPADELMPALRKIVYLPEYFQKHGYFTARVSKLGDTVDQALGRKLWVHSEGRHNNPSGRGPKILENDGEDEPDYRTARRVVELLQQNRDKPFFIAPGFIKPHQPFAAPRKYYNLYPPDRIELPRGRTGSDRETRDDIAGYFAATSFMDAQVGVVLEAMDRLKLWESTIVVLFSDHGYQLGEHKRFAKPYPYEECARVPLLVAVPGKKAQNCSRLVELVDLYPTLVELCGLPMPKGLEGTSFAPLLDKPKRPWKKAVFTRIGKRDDWSIRTERFRYITRKGLYDHESDPLEQTNLIKDRRYAPVVKEMQGWIKAGWRAAVPNAGK